MQTNINNIIVKVTPQDIKISASIPDDRIDIIEQLVVQEYNTTTSELSVWYIDSPAKIMCCFLLHRLLNYSLVSIANRYKIDSGFLHKKIHAIYKKALHDKVTFREIEAIEKAFYPYNNKLPQTANNV